MATADQVLQAFDAIRRAHRAGVYAPHKPLLILLALARVQRNEPRLVEFAAVDAPMKSLLAEFGPSSAPQSRHYPFWHLATDGGGAVWELQGPEAVLNRRAAATPNLGELRANHVEGGFPTEIDRALREIPGLLEAVASRVLDAAFPPSLHADISAAVGLTFDGQVFAPGEESAFASTTPERRRRDPAFRERVLRTYEYRCCVCGFDLRIGRTSAGLEAAHIQWHHVGGPDVEPNGLALCALHHKLFDLGAFTIEPSEHRIVFSQHAIAGDKSRQGELRHHGQPLIAAQHASLRPGEPFLAWNHKNVFKDPARSILAA